jgi:uncharacterized protein
MSPGPADQVNAKELAARAAVVERNLELPQLDRVRDAGGLPGTRVAAQLRFGSFERWTTVDVRVEGVAMVPCQRCLQPCTAEVDESARVIVVRDEDEQVPGGYEPFVGAPEHLSLTALVEEQVLLALPLVPMHQAGDAQCRASGAEVEPLASSSAYGPAAKAAAEERQTPFANLRELLDKKSER